MRLIYYFSLFTVLVGFSCGKNDSPGVVTPVVFTYENVLVNGNSAIQKQNGVNLNPLITIKFSASLNTQSAQQNITVTNQAGRQGSCELQFC